MSKSSARPAPRIDRPEIPLDYGMSKATLHVEWGRVEERLTRERVVWLATVGPSGRPRVRPIDAVYLEGVIYVGGSPATRWVQEIGTNPHVSVHLDDVNDVLVVEGDADVITSMDRDLATRLAAASNAKFPEYGMKPAFYVKNGAIAIRPRKVIAWTDIGKDPTRFRLD